MKSLARVDATGQPAPKLLITFDDSVLDFRHLALAQDGKSVYLTGRTPKEGKFVNEAAYCVLKFDIDTQRVEARRGKCSRTSARRYLA